MTPPRLPSGIVDVTWVHSHEEDSATERVYRPRGFAFPPARGRESFRLRAGGALVEGGPGPADVPEEVAGHWSIADDGTITLAGPRTGATPRRLEVVSVSRDRLVVRPPDAG